MKIPITKTTFGKEESDAIVKPLESGWVVQGPYVSEFQSLFSKFTGAKYSNATTSCTTALHLCLEALEIGVNDKVIVPSFTYVASANAVEYTGAQVIFCDIDLNTFNLDVLKLEQLLVKYSDVKAIMPVHLFGLCADMPKIMDLALKYNVKVIEDSACGFDSWIGDQHSGTFGDFGCFSFHPRKSICTGEGGMIITNDNHIAQKISILKDHGAAKSDLERHNEKGGSLLPDFTMRGYNYRMTDMQGALGVCQMNKSSAIMSGRRKVAKKYDSALLNVDQLVLPQAPYNYVHSYQSYVCIFTDGESLDNLSIEKIDRINLKRNIFMEKLESQGVATRQGTHAVHTLSYYKNKNNFKDRDFLMSYAADRLSIALPLYTDMSDIEFDYVIDNMIKALV
ncbi:MAG: DegT/DnrJ/EryC1/StrS family aminotransferase [Candidatus Cloacimonetes bacterium]|nr:DegT/DnrJ/EryC1/StrS family aminotransferase [Candidatus Cloacimonadota bacterium]